MKKLITTILLAMSLSATALSPDMEANRYLLQLEQAIYGKNKDYKQAIAIIDKIMAFKEKHQQDLSIEFDDKYAMMILTISQAMDGKANKVIDHYLTITGKGGKYYGELPDLMPDLMPDLRGANFKYPCSE